ncbi:MAG: helix-turn-helix domain-containing protein [Actinobacteria bacterium]|nr:helix-turn-helix domain-containing protein [Actinomycetota bacterium]
MTATWAGNLIRRARREGGLSQRELARRAATSQPAIAAYESGGRTPTFATLVRIIRAAGLEMRVRLEPYDDHDAWLRRFESELPPETVDERRRRDAELAASGRRRRR